MSRRLLLPTLFYLLVITSLFIPFTYWELEGLQIIEGVVSELPNCLLDKGIIAFLPAYLLLEISTFFTHNPEQTIQLTRLFISFFTLVLLFFYEKRQPNLNKSPFLSYFSLCPLLGILFFLQFDFLLLPFAWPFLLLRNQFSPILFGILLSLTAIIQLKIAVATLGMMFFIWGFSCFFNRFKTSIQLNYSKLFVFFLFSLQIIYIGQATMGWQIADLQFHHSLTLPPFEGIVHLLNHSLYFIIPLQLFGSILIYGGIPSIIAVYSVYCVELTLLFMLIHLFFNTNQHKEHGPYLNIVLSIFTLQYIFSFGICFTWLPLLLVTIPLLHTTNKITFFLGFSFLLILYPLFTLTSLAMLLPITLVIILYSYCFHEQCPTVKNILPPLPHLIKKFFEQHTTLFTPSLFIYAYLLTFFSSFLLTPGNMEELLLVKATASPIDMLSFTWQSGIFTLPANLLYWCFHLFSAGQVTLHIVRFFLFLLLSIGLRFTLYSRNTPFSFFTIFPLFFSIILIIIKGFDITILCLLTTAFFLSPPFTNYLRIPILLLIFFATPQVFVYSLLFTLISGFLLNSYPAITKFFGKLTFLKSNKDLSPITTRFLLLIICAVGAFFRFHETQHALIGIDGWATWRFGGGSFWQLLQSIAQVDCHPPLFYILQFFSESLLGLGRVAVFLPNFVISVAVIPAAYQLGKTFTDRKLGLLLAAWFACHPWLIGHAGYIRMYSLLLLLTILLLHHSKRALDGSQNSISLLVPLSTLLIMTQYMGIFSVLALIVAVLLSGKQGYEVIKSAIQKRWYWLTIPFLWSITAIIYLKELEKLPLTYQIAHSSLSKAFTMLLEFSPYHDIPLMPQLWFLLFFPLPLFFKKLRNPNWILPTCLLLLTSLGQYGNSALVSYVFGAGVIQSNHLIGTLPAFALLLMMLIRKISNTNIRRGLLVFLVVNPLLLLITMFYSGNINPWFTFQETRRYNQCAATVIPTAYDQEAFPPGKTGCLPWQIPYLDLPQTPYYWRKTKGELSPSIGQEMGLVAESNSLLDDKSAINKDTFSITLQKIPTHGTLTFDDSERRRLRLFFIHQPGTLAVDLRGWPKVSSIFMENILSNQTGEQLSLPSGEISYIPSQNKDWNFRRKRLYFLQWLCPNLRGENFGYAFFILLLLGVFSATLKEKFHL